MYQAMWKYKNLNRKKIDYLISCSHQTSFYQNWLIFLFWEEQGHFVTSPNFSHQNQLIQLPFEARNSKCISFPFNILHISRWRKSLSSKTSRRINDIMTGNCTLLDTYLLWQQLVTCDNSGIQYTAIIYLINTFCLEITGNRFIQFQSERNQLALLPNMCGFSLHHILLAWAIIISTHVFLH